MGKLLFYISMAKNIKILLTIPFFYPHRGGAQKYAEELLVHLKELSADIQVDVLCYNTDNAPEIEAYRGLNIYRVPCYSLITGKFVLPKVTPLLKILNKLSKNGYSHVNSHTAFFDTTWWAWLYAKKIGAKSIFTGHAPGHPTHHNMLVELVGKLVHLTLGKWSVQKYDIYTYANNKSKQFFEEKMGAKNGGKVIHIAIDPIVFNTTPPSTNLIPKSQSSKRLGEIFVTYIGRMIDTKGVMLLYKSITDLKNQIDPTLWQKLTFVFAGPGYLNKTIAEQSINDGLENKVMILKNIDSDQVAQLLKLTDVFVSPSTHSEGLPNTILEAGASGCIIIATNSGSIGDIVQNRKTGFIIPMKDQSAMVTAIKYALMDSTVSRTMANNMTKLIMENYTWSKSAQEFYTLLKDNGNL